MKTKKTYRIISALALTALFVSSMGFGSATFAQVAPETVQVTIVKFIDGDRATAESASSTDFQMSATWNAENIGPGTGQYALSAGGFNGDLTPYQAITAEMTSGADYATNEIVDGNVVASCDTDAPYSLVGYTSGETLEQAALATPSLVSPAFVNLTSDKFVIVWNRDCATPLPAESVQVHISKYIGDNLATASSTNGASFPMSATWDAANIGAGTGEYSLDSVSENPYQTQTVAMDPGADYSTNEILTGETVGASCAGDAAKDFALQGYTVGNSYAEAATGTPSMSIPTFVDLTSDKYVIVWNLDCNATEGEIGGTVEGPQGTLAVTSIDAVDTTATADGSFENGWEYVFRITAPSNEQDLSMKFSNWMKSSPSGTIAVANNMRISSAQANNAGATVLLTAADTYSSPALHMTGDLNPAMVGRQVEVTVEVAIPSGTPEGSYTTNYGVKTE